MGSDDDIGGSPAGWAFYGIATADRPERLDHLVSEFRRAALPLTVFESHRPTEAGGWDGTGVRGCFESHLRCLAAARDDGVDVAVLVEDDVVLVDGLAEQLALIAVELADLQWSMVYLGYLGDSSPVRRSELTLVSPHIAASAGWEVIGAHLIAIRGSALDGVIADFEGRLQPGGRRIPTDGAYNEHRRTIGAPTLLCVPNLGRQAPSPSGITAGSGLRRRLLELRSVRWGLLAAKRQAWDLQSRVPPSRWVQIWNRRAAIIGLFDAAQSRRRPAS